MRSVVTSDIHLTASPDDEYRWNVFGKLKDLAKQRQAEAIFILGDLTDKKDKHPASLVNRICSVLGDLVKVAPLHILKGNHDYVDPECPFFHFTNSIDGVTFHTKPFLDPEERFLMLPHTRDPLSDWTMQDTNYPLVFMHQTVSGAKASNGVSLEDKFTSDWFGKPAGTVFSGDIHVPQKVGKVVYVGAPHPVRFGDLYSPRFVSTAEGKWKSHAIETIRKISLELSTVEDLLLVPLREHDQVKIALLVSKAEIHLWDELRAETLEICSVLGVNVSSLTSKIVRKTAREKRIDKPLGSGKSSFLTYVDRQGLDMEIVNKLLEQSDEDS